MSHRFPPELFNEIISYLWNDIPSLKACSLAHPTMTFPSQTRLFYSICLQPPRKRLSSLTFVKNEISGTSYDFWRMLVRSPHIAGYIRSLFVIDHGHSYRRCFGAQHIDSASSEDDQTESSSLNEDDELGNGEYVVSKPTPIGGAAQKTANLTWRIPRWLANDKYLPRCALLHHLKAFTLIYDEEWGFLSSKIHIALLRLMRLPSLLYIQLGSKYPSALFNVAIGDSVKHLVLHGCPHLPSYPSFPDARPQDRSTSIP